MNLLGTFILPFPDAVCKENRSTVFDKTQKQGRAGAPRRLAINKAALLRVGEDAAQTRMDTLERMQWATHVVGSLGRRTVHTYENKRDQRGASVEICDLPSYQACFPSVIVI